MAKGFSLLELAAIITCASLAINTAANDSHISLRSITSQAHHAFNQSSVLDANRYLVDVGRALEQVNNS